MNRRFRHLLVGLAGAVVLAVVVIAVVLVPAFDGDGEPAPTALATAGPSLIREAATPEPAPSAFVLPTPWARGDEFPLLPPNGVWLVDAATGERTVLYESDGWLRGRLEPGIRFTPSGERVWLSPSEASRAEAYAVDGSVVDRIDGAGIVIESPSGAARAYRRLTEEGATSGLVVEHDGAVYEAPGRLVLLAFAPAGDLLAYVDVDETNSGALTVLDLASGERRVVAENLSPCECDGTAGPVWSPSGRYLAYVDFDEFAPVGDTYELVEAGGAYVVDLATGVRRRLSGDPRALASPPWLPNDDTVVLSSEGRISLHEAVSGVERVISDLTSSFVVVDPGGRGIAAYLPVGDPPYGIGETVALTLPDGREVGRWNGTARVVWTAGGPAAAIVTAGRSASCVFVEHPSLTEEHCIGGTTEGAWSPDGRYLALVGGGAGSGRWQVAILDTANGRESIVGGGAIPEQPTVRWNAASTHFLVVWPSGL